MTQWDVQTGDNRWTWTETPGTGDYRGYKLDNNPRINETRWGTNRIEDDFKVVGESDPGHTTIVQVGGAERDLISLVTLWDETGGTPHEAQAVSGDSGGGVFYKRGVQWELAGILNAVLTFPNQRPDWSVFGQSTVIADLSSYRNEIVSIMDDPSYSIVGDINLDGVISGDGSGLPESDDLAAFANGWMIEHAVANIDSWKLGDLNQDAITDLHDFRLLRNAHPAAASIAPALGLSSAAVIPEPTSWVSLILCGAAAWMLMRRRAR